MKIGPLLPELS